MPRTPASPFGPISPLLAAGPGMPGGPCNANVSPLYKKNIALKKIAQNNSSIQLCFCNYFGEKFHKTAAQFNSFYFGKKNYTKQQHVMLCLFRKNNTHSDSDKAMEIWKKIHKTASQFNSFYVYLGEKKITQNSSTLCHVYSGKKILTVAPIRPLSPMAPLRPGRPPKPIAPGVPGKPFSPLLPGYS